MLMMLQPPPTDGTAGTAKTVTITENACAIVNIVRYYRSLSVRLLK
jgi:hypothetical protein